MSLNVTIDTYIHNSSALYKVYKYYIVYTRSVDMCRPTYFKINNFARQTHILFLRHVLHLGRTINTLQFPLCSELLSPSQHQAYHHTGWMQCALYSFVECKNRPPRREKLNGAQWANLRRPAPSSSSTTIDHCSTHHPARVQYIFILMRVFCKSRVEIRRRHCRFEF